MSYSSKRTHRKIEEGWKLRISHDHRKRWLYLVASLLLIILLTPGNKPRIKSFQAS